MIAKLSFFILYFCQFLLHVFLAYLIYIKLQVLYLPEQLTLIIKLSSLSLAMLLALVFNLTFLTLT